jgi:putative glutamine amidotransferase
MKKVLISQRCDCISHRDEMRDCLDSRFSEIIWKMGLLPIPVANFLSSPEAYIEAVAPDAILLTGGNDLYEVPQRDFVETALLNFSAIAGIPVIGVCRGMQMINMHQGGSLVSAPSHVSTLHKVTGSLHPEGRLVNSYHKWAISKQTLGRELEVLAVSGDGHIEAFRHLTLPWIGMMWHPERERPVNMMDFALFSAI